MLRELLQELNANAEKTITPKFVKAPGEPEDVYYLCGNNQPPKRIQAEPTPRNYTAGCVDAVCQVVADWAAHGESNPEVWYCRNKVFAFMNAKDRRDCADFEFKFTDQFLKVQELSTPEWMSQKEILRLLRIDLHDCLEQEGSLIKNLQRIAFSAEQGATGTIIQGKSSMSREMKAELKGQTELPEFVKLDVPVWESPRFRTMIKCALETNPESANSPFCLIPLAGEIERGLQDAEDYLGTLVRGTISRQLEAASCATFVPIYHGNP